ncbi:Star lipid transfer-like protein [Thalictrum thalictroides]|uniref:Star lipid transfer-like protein n=1 Tax=Thalictrum thalictroides TaxID=46969 RepID=A0A7J6W5R3_THATH|nr:Star lipid transfer-like protein [Thalictrum thalictroides]
MGEEESTIDGSSTSNYYSDIESHWWWALGSATQAVTGMVAYRRGRRSESQHLMPLRAFFVASLVVGTGATAIAGCLSASGIHKIEDLKNVGKNIRTGLGVRPRETGKSN